MSRYRAVVVGASAGGVEALLALFGRLPVDYALPIVTVLHLPDARHSHLAEVFERRLCRPVKEACDKAQVEPGVIYFAGPSYHLSVEQDETFSLSQEERVHYSRPSIDVLFESAADAWGAALAGVLLTGANEDGARGLAEIARNGGLTLVQDPAEARVSVMPEAALKLIRPDYLLPIVGLAEVLAELGPGTCKAQSKPNC
ncbi:MULTISPECIES: chemotaxis protein CheB [unclassified Pseudomonas]|uniref:chemotaxis protein CheB n=1 Tax=unclassified Pseudomonas TaxID=196821 RepID=UPI000BDCBCCA|nr:MULTISPECIES: chemotaxis protein CheB [unclassified Pseudomonas]PVZ20251.1 two-component system chemotaxis response regulator CheB [Pseudomonas sp. URIL14HWK12:I12]PVZ27317.1 two-component system chemotaxis response regulator CheB [Pseudomonas sp. URIL14HWK12:I10]PVZ38206.1 two-component system chemotaxis response regulator CheB [Pseudomonas sp. URIL14HWK12:I11]SNZ04243.1 two-component system, chemotaxis family, response regulator CheB [Pseudomonas sp. URIL14HWK12:I9]